jgi:hypothetical protein
MKKSPEALKLVLNLPERQWARGLEAAQYWARFHGTPEWDRRKTEVSGGYRVHETRTGTIVVNTA